MTIATTDGRTLHLFVEHAVGSPARPMSDAELDRKVHDLCEPILAGSGARRFTERCRGLATADSLAPVIAAGVPPR